MKAWLVKHWFLLLLLGGLVLAWLRPYGLRAVADWVEPRVIIAAALLLVAWGLDTRSLVGALVRPWPALWAVALSYGALPALALLAGRLLSEDDFRIGLLISASVPCTLASAVLWTRMAGGNDALALLITLFTTLTSWLATTAWLSWAAGAEVAVDTAAMMRDLVLILCVPLALGQAGRAFRPWAAFVDRHRAPFGVVSRLLILAVMLKAAVGVFDQLDAKTTALSVPAILAAAAVAVATHLAALLAGLWSGRALGFDRPSCIAVAIACSQKTLPVALILFETYFKDRHPLAVVPIVCYHVGQLVVDTFIADHLAGRPSADVELAAEAVD